jgi:hypothetical protein
MRKTTTDKILATEKEIEELISYKKELLAKHKEEERKARTKRLCDRAGYLESILPDTVTLTNEQFQSFLNKTLLTDYARKAFNSITAAQAKPAAEEKTEAAQGTGTTAAEKTAETAA